MATIEVPYNRAVIDSAQPGDVFCLTDGIRDRLRLVGLRGTTKQPIRLTGNGTNIRTDAWAGIDISNCQHLIVEGIEISAAGNVGLVGRQMSEYVELRNLDIHHAGQAGIRFHTFVRDASADWIQHDVWIHHCQVHNCQTEAMYLGHASTQNEPTCPIHGLTVEHCHVERCGYGGIQIRGSTGVLVRRNTILDSGLTVDKSHAGGGMIVGPEIEGVWSYNDVAGCERAIHLLNWIGPVEMHHNLFTRNGLAGPKREQPSVRGMGNGTLELYHNTIVLGGAGEAVRIPDGRGEIFDNVLADPGAVNAPGFVVHHNATSETIAEMQFSDPEAGDWTLLPGSPAIGTASDGEDCGAFHQDGDQPGPEPEPEPELPEPEPVEGKRLRALIQVLDKNGNVAETFTIEGEWERLGQ